MKDFWDAFIAVFLGLLSLVLLIGAVLMLVVAFASFAKQDWMSLLWQLPLDILMWSVAGGILLPGLD